MEFENMLKLIQTVSDSKLTDFKYEENGVKLVLSKKEKSSVNEVSYIPAQAPDNVTVVTNQITDISEKTVTKAIDAEDDQLSGNIIKSPLVGTFYSAPAEDADAFVSLGDTVKKGQTLAIIEAMKLMNEIESEFDGKIVEIYVENAQAVEWGQPLFRVE
ncbi:MAG: acetyl-CoA carboxylase biotin carboxyl carrier protein [Lachnospiraceae bacterium]|nr:acetyl-CoA carboxylase biotin carboxyl carrier protein [Lachnospiraceae bacterium]MDE6698037.1 acetyl-CoA carboxylase biotin carboxyl carrier protein [Lachnospiraceae bacterium]